MEDKYIHKRGEIIDFLKRKGVKEEVDDTLIDELIFNMKLIDECKDKIANKDGSFELMINVSKKEDSPYYQVNPIIKLYQDSFKTIRSISISLGLTPADRHKLGLNTSEIKDELDELIG
jgi:P27 family predicted phage terminase small subunit